MEVRVFENSPIGPMLIVHLLYDCRDAMGANAVNTAVERLAPMVEEITGGRVVLRILSNLADRRLARARCAVPVKDAIVAASGATNQALVLDNTGDGEYGGNASNDTTMTIIVHYGVYSDGL